MERTIFLEVGEEHLLNLYTEDEEGEQALNLKEGDFELLYQNRKKSPFNRINALNGAIRDLCKDLFPDLWIIRVAVGDMKKRYSQMNEDGEITFYYELEIYFN